MTENVDIYSMLPRTKYKNNLFYFNSLLNPQQFHGKNKIKQTIFNNSASMHLPAQRHDCDYIKNKFELVF